VPHNISVGVVKENVQPIMSKSKAEHASHLVSRLLWTPQLAMTCISVSKVRPTSMALWDFTSREKSIHTAVLEADIFSPIRLNGGLS